MLVLSRKVGETIEIGSGITVIIHRVAGGRVQIGIEAPRDIPVQRGELITRPRFRSDDSQSNPQSQPDSSLLSLTGETR